MATPKSKELFDNTNIDTLRLLQEIRELRQRIDDGALEPALPNDSMPEVIIEKDSPNPCDKINPTSFPIYAGDKSSYLAWRRAILSALRIVWNTFGCSNSRVFLMIYKALE